MKAKHRPSKRESATSNGTRSGKIETPAQDQSGTHWQQLCSELKEERDRLQEEVVKLRAERDQHLKALCRELTAESLSIDKKALLAQVGQGQSLRELIAELESRGS